MRRYQKMHLRTAICNLAAASLVLQTILPGAVPAEEILPESEITAETAAEFQAISEAESETETKAAGSGRAGEKMCGRCEFGAS